MRKYFITGVCVLSTILPGVAQEAEEATFLQEATEQMNEYAALCVRNGFPGRARETWFEIISEYDPDDPTARKNLGFSPVGTSWERIAGFEPPDRDNPDTTVARLLQRRWDALTETLAEGHRRLASTLRDLGKSERADYHFNRTLRFVPDDPVASEARGMESYEGFYGTLTQLELLRRSRLMERAVSRLAEAEFRVEVLSEDASHPFLKRAEVAHRGVRSSNFTIWGDWEEDLLVEAARYCERALAFCEEVFEGYPEFPPAGGITSTHAYFRDKASWVKVVEANRHRIGDRVDFVLEIGSSTSFGSGPERIHVAGYNRPPVVLDMAVRWVAEDYSGLRTDALVEGIGHAVVGKFFGRNLVFSVAPEERQGTASGQQRQMPLMPDLTSWGERVLESAWEKSGTPAPRLPLIKASAFPEDGRLKAWSFSDYLLRLDPHLLRALDQTVSEGATRPDDVIAGFQEASGVSLLELDENWRRFWTEDTPLNRAIHSKETPLEAVSKAAPAWLDAFNELRRQHSVGGVGWSAALSVECKQHAEYLRINPTHRVAGKENTQDSGFDGFSNAGRAFAQTALVETRGTNARRVMRDWMDLPGHRDAILHRDLRNIGLYVDGPIVVMDVVRGSRPSQGSVVMTYPDASNTERNPVARSLDLELLGPEIEELAKQRPGRPTSQIGYPLSIHFYDGLPTDRDAVQCRVTVDGEQIGGTLHRAYESQNHRTGAPGMLVFYPHRPLPRDVAINVLWSYEPPGRRMQRIEFLFFAK